MENEKKINLRPVWDATLNVYREIAEICQRHNLRYYLTDGTAIGAVRHRGFIPWDDDFDISMPREDYRRFIEYSQKELPSHLKFVNWENTPELIYLFGKVQETDKNIVEAVESKCGYMLTSGIYVDIIPIDGYPESRIEQFLVRGVVGLLSCIIRFRCMSIKAQSKKGKLVWVAGLLLTIPLPFLNGNACKKICEKLLMRHPFANATFTGRASLRLTILNRPPMPMSYWGEPSHHFFEGMDMPLPHDYDAYLRFYYGDYMTPPPESQQHPSHEYSKRCAWWLGPTKNS